MIDRKTYLKLKAIVSEYEQQQQKIAKILDGSDKILSIAKKRGFMAGVSYKMNGATYTVKGKLFVRNMYKFGEGTVQNAMDYYVINHDRSNGYIYSSKTKKWATIIKPII